jgi:hypothetical protein
LTVPEYMQFVVLSVLDFDFSITVRPLRGAGNRNTSGSAGDTYFLGSCADTKHANYQHLQRLKTPSYLCSRGWLDSITGPIGFAPFPSYEITRSYAMQQKELSPTTFASQYQHTTNQECQCTDHRTRVDFRDRRCIGTAAMITNPHGAKMPRCGCELVVWEARQ